MSIAACTIVTRNHLAFARLVGRSWTDHHPGSPFTVVVVDQHGTPAPNWNHRDIRIIGPDALGVSTEQLHTLAAIYGAAELACALKPAALRLLLDEVDVAVYLDGDMEVLDGMGDLEDLARQHGVVLSPHNLEPIPDDGLLPDRFTMLGAGVFNGGLVAVSREDGGFTEWWGARLRRDGIHEAAAGMHGDQRWLDLVPSYFGHHVLRDPTFNVAYWNLHERPTSWDGEELCVGGRRVRTFHYSGLLDAWPTTLSSHTSDRPRVELRDHPAVARACRRYVERLRAAGLSTDRALPYRFAAAADGTPVDRRARRLFRDQLLASEADRGGAVPAPPNPFADGGKAWVAWLGAPAEEGGVSRYLQRLWDESPELQRLHPDLRDPYDRARFSQWALRHGTETSDIPPSLMPDPEDTLMDDLPVPDRPRRTPHRPDVRSQQPVPELDSARGALEAPIDERGSPRSARRFVGKAMKSRDERHDAVARNLADAVAELTERIAELGRRVNRVDDELPEQAERIDQIDDTTKVLTFEQEGLTERIEQLDVAVETESERIDGALEQDIITSSILADAEARLTAEVADLQLRLDKMSDDPTVDPDDSVDLRSPPDDAAAAKRAKKELKAGPPAAARREGSEG